MEINLLKEIHRNSMDYMKQFNQVVKESLKKIQERKDQEDEEDEK